jgi:hypothetical protein
LPGLIASLFPNLSFAPIRLPGKALHHIFESPTAILQNIRRFYTGEVLKQIYRVIGSLDSLGNPTLLLSSFLSGVRDMVVAPSVALLKTPTDPSRAGFILAQGTLSLVSQSASGFFGTLARVSASAGQAVAALSLDVEYRDWHRNQIVAKTTNLSREWKKRGLQTRGKIILRPFADLLIGVSGGVVGVVVQPLKGFRQDGRRGFCKGAAIGLVGLVAKPIVGILDSFAHFTISIHDLAKSVNVLDKRIQPASRLRLPYCFGPLGILAPYNADVARAKRLLHQFPLRLSRQATLPAEIIVHVEFLPGGITFETAIIATSQRIAVLQVREELAGYPVADLCWQGCYADSIVLSRLDDQMYGHGASLTLTSKKVSDANSRTESSDDVLFEPKPGSSSKLAFSLGLSTPKERQRPWKAARESESNIGNDGGTVQNRFTIIAEYQFRQQLARFHNVVSCISGRFDDLLLDDPDDSTNCYIDGSTCFGMFLFDRSPPAFSFAREESMFQLDYVAWIPKNVILAHTRKSPHEQKLALATLREQWAFSDEMEAAKSEGGPAWLVEANAWSRFIGADLNQQRAKQPMTLSWAEDGGISGNIAVVDGTETNHVQPMRLSSLHGFASAHQTVESDDNYDDDGNDDEGNSFDDQFPAAPGGIKCRSRRQSASRISALSSRSSPSRTNNAMRRSDARASFATANPIPTGDDNNTNNNKAVRRSDSYATYFTANSQISPRSSNDADDGVVADQFRGSVGSTRGPRDRLDRMEDLLERLVLVTSENVMQHSQPHRRNEESSEIVSLERLRRDVDELRTQIVPSVATVHELDRLRSEVAWLRAQLGLEQRTAAAAGDAGSATTPTPNDPATTAAATATAADTTTTSSSTAATTTAEQQSLGVEEENQPSAEEVD